MTSSKLIWGASGLLLVALATPGCATKKFVRTQVGTVDQRVSEVDKKQTTALSNLEGKETKDVSRVEERAMTAENKANDAARAAQQADQHAQAADQTARNATDLAQQAQNRVGEVSQAVQNIDNYKLQTTQDVLFGFNKATLAREGQEKLDQIVQQSQGMPRYVVEISGFTDRTGPRDYNLALSRRRADTVMRYLVDHNVPLRRIHMIGLGEVPKDTMAMAGGNATAPEPSTRLTRKEMRHVVVNLYAPETTLAASSNAPQSQQMKNTNQVSTQEQTTPPETTPPPSPR
jgi:OOP family OmpA-OmpF porin